MMSGPARAVLVTGGSSGLGLEVARRLAGRGFVVGLMARDSDRLNSAVLELGGNGSRLVACRGDAAEPADCARAVAGLIEVAGGLDALVCCAGTSLRAPVAQTSPAVAEMVMRARLPLRLLVLIGAVENAVSGQAMRPMDVLRTRKGLKVEIGNTDAEGRLVLCDLLSYAAEHNPAMIIDAATLTGAARVALGPDLPALFSNDETLAANLLAAGTRVQDPMWRLPLHDGYDSWLDSPFADLSNVSTKPMAGAVTAALFLRRFLPAGMPWAHFDLYAWNDAPRPGRPEGGEAQAARAIFAMLREVAPCTNP